MIKPLRTLLFLLITAHAAQAQFSLSVNGFAGIATGDLKKTVPVYGGMDVGLGYRIKESPFTIGWRIGFGSYGSHREEYLPYSHRHYDYDTAHIINKHRIVQHFGFVRAELFRRLRFSPYIELGVGLASYNTRWRVEGFEDEDGDGFYRSNKFFANNTPMAGGSAGFIYRVFSADNDQCTNIWITLAVDYYRGQQVRHLNSELNYSQFHYSPGSNAPTNPYLFDLPDDDYLAQPVYRARHEMWQIRLGVTFAFGDCGNHWAGFFD